MTPSPFRPPGHPLLPVRTVVAALLAATLTSVSSVAAQRAGAADDRPILRGTVVSEMTDAPVDGALVAALDTAGESRARALTDADGAFSLELPGAGVYRLEVERIGFRSWTGSEVRLGADEVRTVRYRIPEQPVRLRELAVTTESRCDLEPGEAEAVERVWTEVRKALERTSLGERRARYRFSVLNRERVLDPERLRPVRRPNVESGEAVTRRPYASLRGADLASRGYVREGEDRPVYYAPDAEALLSTDFRTTHCLGLLGENDAEDGRIGVTFEPVEDRDVADIAGVFRVDAASSALEELAYTYTELPGSPDEDQAGGRIRFARLPDGGWYVSDWRLRLPVYGDAVLPRNLGTRGQMPGPRRVVQAVYEVGGEVTEVRTRAGELLLVGDRAALSGTVYDRFQDAPLPGAIVTVEGTGETATADSSGRFRLPSVPLGEHRVTFEHPSLEVFGIRPEPVPWNAEAGEESRLRLETPSVEEALAEVCEDAEARVLVGGRVVSAPWRRPVPDAGVRVTWLELGLEVADDVDIVNRRRLREASTGEDGTYRLCLPETGEYRITVRREGFETVGRELTVEDGDRVLEEDVRLGAEERGTPRERSGRTGFRR